MTALHALLDLQDHDIRIDQLEHRLATLPERELVEANRRAVADLDVREAGVRHQRDELAHDQKRIEDEVATVESKATAVHDKLYGGTVTSPKELQAFQEDFDSLKRRQRELEDRVITVMEATEPVDDELAALAARRAELEGEGRAAESALTDAEAAVRAELTAVQAERETVEGNVAPEQLAEYNRLRPQYAGIAVARLVGTNCHGCHLSLSAMALDKVRSLPADAVAYCDECGRILVR